MARVESDGTRALVFLVLWRGAPAWFARGSGNGSSGGGNCGVYHSTIRRGDVQLQIEFDFQTRLATITQALFVSSAERATVQTKQVDLRDRNVVLVDGVDDAKGQQVVGTLRVDPALPPGNSPAWVGETLRSSPELMSFLRCDTRLDDPLAQRASEIVCASILGK